MVIEDTVDADPAVRRFEDTVDAFRVLVPERVEDPEASRRYARRSVDSFDLRQGRVARLIPPARKHVVRYYGALGPRSPLRGGENAATKGKATSTELESGYSVTVARKIAREAKRAAGAAGRAWAACLRKVFEVDPVKCEKCGGEMKLVAVILEDKELERILAHQG